MNDKRALGETIENLEAVSHLITRYAILEELYLQRNSAARDKLEDMVVRLYAEILTFLARARKYFQSSAKSKNVSAHNSCQANKFSPSGYEYSQIP